MLAALAERQHGRVARRQIIGALTHGEIDARVRSGHLCVVHRGVYAVGHAARSRSGDLSAAALAHWPLGGLAFESAAEHLLIGDEHRGPIHVLVPPGVGRTPRRGVAVHRTRELREEDFHTVRGIRCTTAARTLADLSTRVTPRRLERYVARAEQRYLLDVDATLRACRGGVRGHEVLRALLGRQAQDLDTDTAALFLAVLDEYGLPHPELEVPYRRWRLDAYYREQRVAIELNGFGTHSRRDRFERDHELAASLTRDGIRPQPFSHAQVRDRPREVAETVAALLGVSTSASR